MIVSRFGRRAAAVAAGALVLALLPQLPVSAVGDSISLSGITAGSYVPAGSTRTITASASTSDTALSISVLVDGTDEVNELCDPQGQACTASFSITIPSGIGAHSVVVELFTDVSGASPAATDSVAFIAGDEPTASIVTPTSGAFVGSVNVSVRGTTDSGGTDYPEAFQLLVGGSPLAGGTAGACASNARTCTQVIPWSTVGLTPATYQISVRVTTHEGVVRTSSAVSLRVANAPTVTISSPADNAQHVLPNASDVVTFTVTAGSDNGLGPTTKLLELFLDGSLTATSSLTCSAGTGSNGCTNRSLTWTASAAAGASVHTAVVRVTVLGATATDSATFRLAEEPAVTVVAPSAALSGTEQLTVTAQTDGLTVEDPKSVVLTATNAIGDPAIQLSKSSCDAAPVDGACTFTVPWDVSLLSGSYSVRAELTTTTGRTRTSAVTDAVIRNVGPVITVTAPTATVIKGRVVITGSARIGTRITGHITTLKLFAQGKQIGTTKTCSVGVTPCTYSKTWDTTLLPNTSTAQIQAQVTTSTTGAQPFNSDAKVVTLRNPKPSATFVSPKSYDVVSGSRVTIKVGLKTDTTQSDLPKSAAIYRNGSSSPFDTFVCSGTSHSCIATFTWNASRAAGVSGFVVKVRTTKSRNGSSAARRYYASSGARITFTKITTVDNGARVTVSGKLVAVRTGLPIKSTKVSILRDPAIGASARSTVLTSSTGRFSLTFTARSNTRLTATSVSLRSPLGEIYVPPATAAVGQTVRAPMTCRVANSVVSRGQKGRGSCTVPGLPFNTQLYLRYLKGGVWRELASGRSSSTTIPFVYQFPSTGFYQLRVILSGSKVYAGTNSRLMPVTVR